MIKITDYLKQNAILDCTFFSLGHLDATFWLDYTLKIVPDFTVICECVKYYYYFGPRLRKITVREVQSNQVTYSMHAAVAALPCHAHC